MNAVKNLNKTSLILLFLLAIKLFSADIVPETKIDFKGIDTGRDKAFTDIDGDGLFDLVIGTLDGKLFHYEQDATNSSTMKLITKDFNNFEDPIYSTPAFCDIDRDGLLDMFIGEYSGNIKHYKQDNKNPYKFSIISDDFSNINVGKAPVLAFTDIDGDELLDLIIGTLNNNLIRFEQDEVNSTEFSFISDEFSNNKIGNYLTPTFTDVDNNGLLDLLIGRLNQNLVLYGQNEINSTEFSPRTEYNITIGAEYYSPPYIADIDNDGLLDLFIGGPSGNIDHFEQYRENVVGCVLEKGAKRKMQAVNTTSYDNKIEIAEIKPQAKQIIADTKIENIKDESTDEEIIEEEGESKECVIAKKELADKTAEFESIRTKMAGKVTTKEYNTLYEKYKSTWTDIGKAKQKISKLQANKNNEYIELYNEALEAKELEDYDEALELLEESVSLNKNFDKGYYQIVSILIEMEEDSEINGYIEKITNTKMKGKIYYRRAMNIKNSYPGKAITYLKRMAELYNPELAYYYMGLINVTMLEDSESAVKYLEKSLKIVVNDPKVLDLIGATLIDMKAPKGEDKNKCLVKAVKYLERGISNGDNYNKLDLLSTRLAQAYNRLGKSKKALKYAELALKKTNNSNLATANLEKGKALIEIGQKVQARKFLKLAKDDLLTREEATYWLKQL